MTKIAELAPKTSTTDPGSTLAGVALRDWFAGQALVGLIPAPARPGVPRPDIPGMAKQAYEYADAMMNARGA